MYWTIKFCTGTNWSHMTTSTCNVLPLSALTDFSLGYGSNTLQSLGAVSWIMAPRRCPHADPRNLCEYVILHGKIDFADGIKSKVLRCGEYLELSGWALSTVTRVFVRRNRKMGVREGDVTTAEVRVCRAVGQEMQPWAAGKGKERIFL